MTSGSALAALGDDGYACVGPKQIPCPGLPTAALFFEPQSGQGLRDFTGIKVIFGLPMRNPPEFLLNPR